VETVDRAKVKNGLLVYGVVLLLAYISMYFLDVNNIWVWLHLKITSFGLVPSMICFGWLYYWTETVDRFRFLTSWNSVTQALFLVLTLIRLKPASWGIMVWLYLIQSTVLIWFYLNDRYKTKVGFWLTGGFILLNVGLAFGVVMTTFDHVHPFLANPEIGQLTPLGSFITEVSAMGALFASSSQLYWHEILGKKREDEFWVKLLESLEDTEPDYKKLR
jgi:hypothetical protein